MLSLSQLESSNHSVNANYTNMNNLRLSVSGGWVVLLVAAVVMVVVVVCVCVCVFSRKGLGDTFRSTDVTCNVLLFFFLSHFSCCRPYICTGRPFYPERQCETKTYKNPIYTRNDRSIDLHASSFPCAVSFERSVSAMLDLNSVDNLYFHAILIKEKKER